MDGARGRARRPGPALGRPARRGRAGRRGGRGLRLRPAPRSSPAWRATRAAVWIDLEYLSAEAVRRAQPRPAVAAAGRAGHRPDQVVLLLPASRGVPAGCCASPISLARRRRSIGRHGWPARLAHGERRVVACSATPTPPLDALVERLADAPPCWCWPPPGAPAPAMARARTVAGRSGSLRAQPLPWLVQADYDHLLWRLRPELRAGRRLARARAVGRRAVRLADLLRSTTVRTRPSWTPCSTDSSTAAPKRSPAACAALWRGLERARPLGPRRLPLAARRPRLARPADALALTACSPRPDLAARADASSSPTDARITGFAPRPPHVELTETP